MPSQIDPVAQSVGPTFSAPAASVNFEGVPNVNGVLPPDTNGDVGPDHYVQWVNLSFAIYSRSGALLYGPANGRTLWQGFGGPCETRNDGDPIVLYDEHAQRWLMSQFALPNYPRGPFYQCIAISQTPDPQGAYHRYQFSFSKMNDYPKFGVWSDGYYMSINQFTCSVFGCQWAGQGVAAFPRTEMLAGAAASMVYFDLGPVDDTLGGMLPSDLDGPPPPAGAPNYFVQFDDDAWGYSGDQLQLWEFKVNWTTPSSSTFTRKTALPTAAFDSDLCGYNRNCIRQAGSSVRLDAISDRVMYRLQYRNFGTHQTLVTNHTVDVNGSDLAGVRWYEIRLAGGTATIHQQGTFAPDANSRWMASAAMDAAGNIAIGYNVSSAVTFPRISFTGRKATDPLGQMTLAEGDIMLGTGGQTHSASRWGDYSLLAVDPTDGCTFWFTTEYYQNTSSAGWQTRVGAFQIEGCTGGGPAPVNAPTGLVTTAVTASQVALQWNDNSADETNFHIERCTGSGCTSFAEIGQTGANANTFTDHPAANTYAYRVRASRSGTFSGYSNTVSATVPPASEPPAATMHVGSLTGTSAKAGGPNWQASVTIEVVDEDGAPVSGAAVSGTWSAGVSGSATCTTGSSGTCTVTSPKANSKNVGSITFSVSAVSHASLTYQASANVQIVVSKP